jgi:DNA-directed RNA polymerase specialized sigma24 family protein
VLRTDLTDHRSSDDATLVRAVADGDAIALAEAYHRTITAAHACARRLLASPVEVEALLRSVYAELWEEPPVDDALEGWVRARSFALGTGYLRQRGLEAPSPSLAAWTSGVDADERNVANDPLERMIGELERDQQAALVRAHDQGIRTADQDDGAGEALKHALLALASPLSDAERHAAEMCNSGVALANWIFGLLPPHEAATVPGTAAEPTPCGRLAGVLRRARRRFEPLPPTPDLGHRVLAWVLSNGQARGHLLQASSLDADLRVASSDFDRGVDDRVAGVPRSSLDMSVPSSPPAQVQQPPVTALRRENGSSPAGWARPDPEPADDDDRPTGDERPTPLRAPSGPPALAGPGATPLAFGNAAPALVPEPVDDDDDEDLVRMPLHRSGRPSLSHAASVAPPAHEADDTQALRPQPDPSTSDDDETAPPPAALRTPREPAPASPHDDTAPPPAGLHGDDTAPPPGGLRFDDDDDTVPPPPALRARDADTAPPPAGLHEADTAPPPGGLRFDDDDDTVPPPPALRARDADRGPSDDQAAPNPLGSPVAADADRGTESPLRRPARGRESLEETQRHTFTGAPDPSDGWAAGRTEQALGREPRESGGPGAPANWDETVQTPIQRDDSDFRADEPFGGTRGDAATASPGGSGGQAANLTAPTLPAARRPTPQQPASRPAQAPRPTGGSMQSSPTGPTVHAEAFDDAPTSGRANRIVRWIVVLLLIAAGAVVGITLGQWVAVG